MTKSGVAARSCSPVAIFGAMTGILAYAAPYAAGIFVLRLAVPAIESWSPSSSRVSVEVWSRATARCGGAAKVAWRPQLVTAVAVEGVEAVEGVLASWAAGAEQAAVARARVRAMPRRAGWRMGSPVWAGRGGWKRMWALSCTGQERCVRGVL